MKFATLAVLASSLISASLAHTTVWSVWVNDVDQGDGRNQYVRPFSFYSMPPLA
jgi:cellulase